MSRIARPYCSAKTEAGVRRQLTLGKEAECTERIAEKVQQAFSRIDALFGQVNRDFPTVQVLWDKISTL